VRVDDLWAADADEVYLEPSAVEPARERAHR